MFFKKWFKSKSTKSHPLQQSVEQALADYQSKLFPCGLMAVAEQLDLVQSEQLVVTFTLPFPCANEHAAIEQHLNDALQQTIKLNIDLAVSAVFVHPVSGVKNIIAISSGKGGVGKSTTTANIAKALQQQGATVAILDGDIHGPSMPTMLGVTDKHPMSPDGVHLQPVDADGIQVMSTGFLGDDDGTRIWKGNVSSKAFEQMFAETIWQDVDYLLIDMPPGTGDIQLSLAQKVPALTTAIVTTPQDVALLDTQKGVEMFQRLNVPILGLIENMSYHICTNCNHKSQLFSGDGGSKLAEIKELKLLGQLPLHLSIRQQADKGEVMENYPDEIENFYYSVANQLASELYYQMDSRSPKQSS